MSGTSLDGVDGVLVRFSDTPGRLDLLGHAHRRFDPALEAELFALNASGHDELHRAALCGNGVARAYAALVEELLDHSGLPATGVRAVGAHGQTVRHRPGAFDGSGYSLQLLNPSLLAERTGIDVVADLRSRDVAAGGQGAPLVPAFHRAFFAAPGRTVGVLNLGGIANLSVLRPDGSTLGFDTGPANVLLDLWCRAHTGASYDADGRWAASGSVVPGLLERLLAEPFFDQPPPKSTGRDLFHRDWLDARLGGIDAQGRPEDVQATLAELTAAVCARELRRHAPEAGRLWVCGGGTFNRDLLRRLAERLPGVQVASSDDAGLAADRVEAVAFAWLARAFCRREPGNLVSVTGARGPRVLGALYPA